MTALTTKMVPAGFELFEGEAPVGMIKVSSSSGLLYTVAVEGGCCEKIFESLEAAEYFALAMVIEKKARAAGAAKRLAEAA